MQPWLMRIGGKKDGKHYRGQREGAVSENTTFYVFTHAPDGSFEAHPIKEWYNFVPRVAHRTLDDEEAEERFAQRDKILSRWTQNLNKKLNPDQGADDDELDDEDNKKGKKKGKFTGFFVYSISVSGEAEFAHGEFQHCVHTV